MSETGTQRAAGSENSRLYVWDAPTRVFHWGLVLAVSVSIITGKFGPLEIHVVSGLTIIALILFRLGWGVVGGRHARFRQFVKGPKAAIAYLRASKQGAAPPHAGHNPLGGYSVLAMLAVIAAQAGTGLFSNDDIMTEGPLFKYVSKSTSNTITYLHGLNSKLIYALIATHIAAVLLYWWKGENLIKPMLNGWKLGFESEGAADDARGSLLVAAFLTAVAVGIAYSIGKI